MLLAQSKYMPSQLIFWITYTSIQLPPYPAPILDQSNYPPHPAPVLNPSNYPTYPAPILDESNYPLSGAILDQSILHRTRLCFYVVIDIKL